MFICALLLPLLASRGKGLLSPLPLFLALFTALIFASHFLGRQSTMFIFCLRTAMVGMIFLSALHAFFLFAPPGRKGLFLGLTLAAAELFWLVMLPGMSFLFTEAPGPALSDHLRKLQILVQCAGGMLVVCIFAIAPAQAAPEDRKESRPAAENGASDATRALPLLFVAAVLFCLAYGVVTGQAMLKIGFSGVVNRLHVLTVVTMPLAGALCDRGGRACRVLFPVLVVLVFAAPLMVFTSESAGGAAREGLQDALSIGRQTVFILTLLLTGRLLPGTKRLPLMLALAFALPPATGVAGAVIARTGGAALAGGISLALALAFAVLAFRLRAALADLPATREEDAALTPDTGARGHTGVRDHTGVRGLADPQALDAFAASYGLSMQEMTVMGMLAQQHSTEAIAKSLGVTENTVRTYVRRLRQKTGTDNRTALVALFASEVPASLETEGTDAL
jgi:DNA-binding CsgD family transcriptional regulator